MIKIFFFYSPTKGASKLELLSNVKSQMTGWLGSGIPIPGLRKTDSQAPDINEPAAAEAVESFEPKPDLKDDDDNSRYNRYGVEGTMSHIFYLF